MKKENGEDQKPGAEHEHDGAGPPPEEDDWSDVRASALKAIHRANASGTMRRGLQGLVGRRGVLLAVGAAALIILAVVVFALVGPSRSGQTPSGPESQAAKTTSPPSAANQQPGARAGSTSQQPPVSSPSAPASGLSPSSASGPQEQQESESWLSRIATICLKIALAALIGTLLAFRPRKDLPVSQRNPRAMQAQILLAVAASCLVMIVAGDVARGLVAVAVTALLIPFRTAELDPKEATVLLICGAVGIATGAGRWAIAIILGLFALLMLWALEHYGIEHSGGPSREPVVTGRKDPLVR